MPQFDKPNSALRKTLLLLIAPVALLTACATPYTPSAPVCPALPMPPSLSEPIPPQSFSERAQQNIKMWQQRQQRFAQRVFRLVGWRHLSSFAF
jgi:hypothetical protein